MERTVWGYCRVSSVDQNLERQQAAMRNEGIDEKHILCDKASGKDFERRTWNLLVGTETSAPLLRKGDLLVVLSLDRLGRNYTEIRKQWEYITTEIGADIKVLDMPLLDTSTTTESLDRRFIANLVLQILSYTAEKERANIRKRQAEGLEVARAHGVKMGRPTKKYPDNWQDVYIRWKQNRITAVDAMRELNLTKPTFYRLVKRYDGKA
ncbi:MAG: recombinase family protein [Gemmiger sp.]|uniref:recombinase family protein n=1 Tax=Gemmiger sp. TaxID=2049027 RepID=UPI002A910EA5|nr:recombinase family protein [Gemmiger sp.]MDY5202789.1 recombinase family protein [Gemmiger sp.]